MKYKKDNNWFIDKDSANRFVLHKVKRRILSTKTKFQNVEIVDTHSLGLVVVLDGKIQSAEDDEFIYHEALVHPAMISHPKPEVVFILGGGEGATLREVLKHPHVRRVLMIDIDKEFVEICKKHLKSWHKNALSDSRVKLIFEDAFTYIQKTKEKADVIIADISDPVEEGPSKLIYTKKFYSLIKKLLASEGIFVTHATNISDSYGSSISPEILKSIRKIFPESTFYYEYVPSFSSLWSFVVGSLKYNPGKISSRLVSKRLKERKLEDLLYYDGETHSSIFFLPKHIRRLL